MESKIEIKVPEKVKKIGYFILKLLVISCVVLIGMWTIVKPVIINKISPALKEIVKEAINEELDFLNYYVSEDILRVVEKQWKKIKEEHDNIYNGDVENAIKYFDILDDRMPEKITPEIEEWMIVIRRWYRGELG